MKTLEIERYVARPPKVCFALWTDPQKLALWWGPRDEQGRPFRTGSVDWTAEVGSPWRIEMFSPSGTRFEQAGEMLEVSAPDLLRFSFRWVEDGVPGPEMEIRIRFVAEEGGTRMYFQQTGLITEHARAEHHAGWQECFDRWTDAAQDMAA